jgi:hypothetical protein
MDNPAISTAAGEKLRDSTPERNNGEVKAASQPPSTTSPTISEPPPATSTNPPSKNDQGWRRVVRNFSPSWFATTMGTGVVAVIFSTIPFEARWLYWMSIFFFALNTLLFSLALVISILRYTLWPEIWSVMIDDPNNSLFLGTVPMGFATLIEMWVHVCVPAWGQLDCRLRRCCGRHCELGHPAHV